MQFNFYFHDEDMLIKYALKNNLFSVEFLAVADLETFFGLTENAVGRGNTESCYILFYEKVNEEERLQRMSNSSEQKTKESKKHRL
jgi:hypothetical protein